MAHGKCEWTQNHKPLGLCSRMGDFPGQATGGGAITAAQYNVTFVSMLCPRSKAKHCMQLRGPALDQRQPGGSLGPGLWCVCCVLFRTLQQRQDSLISRAVIDCKGNMSVLVSKLFLSKEVFFKELG